MAGRGHEFIQHVPRLRRYARALTGDHSRADDLVQDTLERALVKLHLWRQGSDLRAWLVGGRLLPGNQGPVAQFMFQDANGQRLTLYVRTAANGATETAFRFAQERGVSVFYWLDGRFGYALSGEIEKPELLRVAKAVYQQINP